MSEYEYFTLKEADAISRYLKKLVEENNCITLEQLYTIDLDSMNSTVFGALDLLGQLQRWLYDRLYEFATWITSSVSAFIDRTIKPSISELLYAVSGLGTRASEIITILRDIPSRLVSGFEEVKGRISLTLTEIARVGSSIESFRSLVWGGIQNITSIVQGIPGQLGGILSNLESFRSVAVGILGNVSSMLQGVTNIVQSLSSSLEAFKSSALGALAAVGSGLQNLTTLLSNVGSVLNQLLLLAQTKFAEVGVALTNIWGGIVVRTDAVLNLLGQVGAFLDTIAKVVSAKFAEILTYLSRAGEILQKGFSEITQSFNSMGRALESAWEGVVRGLGGVQSVVSEKFEAVVISLRSLVVDLQNLSKYVNAIGAQVLGGLPALAKSITDIFNQLEPISRLFRELVADPGSVFKKYMLEPLWGSLSGLGQWLQGGLKWLVESVSGVIGYLAAATASVVASIRSVVEAAVAAIAQAGSAVSSVIQSSIINLLRSFIEATKITKSSLDASIGEFKGLVDQLFVQTGIKSPPYLTPQNMLAAVGASILYSSGLFASTAIMQLPARAVAFLMRSFGMFLGNALRELKISLKFLGLGGDVSFSIGRAIGSIFYTMGSELSRIYEKWLDYSAMGMLFWYGQATSKLLTFTLRNYLPLEIPPIATTLEFARRARVADTYPAAVGREFKDVLDGLRYYMAVRGFADFVVDMMFADPESYSMKITDRFNKTRTIPLSTWFVLPSPSMLATMIIRDIVVPPGADWSVVMKSIQKLLGAVGMHENIAKLFYIYHYKYPPVEALARFYWRGITGCLWARESFEETGIKRALDIPDSWTALKPIELNYRADYLNSMMSLYLRWHDYFPASWAPNLPTDKSIMYELTADLPTRIDLRWITRWGLFEHLSKLGAKLDTPAAAIKDLMKKATGRETVSSKVTPEITLDVSGLARLLEATGYHPDYVPLLAVAQSHQIITEELTLTRTGFIESYRRGFIDLDTSEVLMSGLFVVDFTTGWIDPQTGKSEVFVYKKPVLWLPAERRLLQLRSVFDRYNILLRDALTRMTRSVQYLALTRTEALDIFSKLFESVSSQWNKEVKTITGVDWKPVLDRAYIELYAQYADAFRMIGMREWTRRYTARIMAWLLYRVSYGWIREEDYEELLKKMLDKGYITDFEKEYFETVFSWLAGLITREYTPSPSALASLAEYMVVPAEVVERAFKTLRVPEDVAELYRKYIQFRPLKADYKQILTVGRRAFIKGAISEQEWRSLLAEATKYGFTDAELKLIEKLVALEIERDMYEVNENLRYPTPLTLAAMAEYCVIPAELVKLAIERYKIAPEYRQLYVDYISTKPLKAEYRTLISTARKALLKGLISEEAFSKILQDSVKYGFTPAEVAIVSAVTTLSELLTREEEYVPTISQLLTLVEYVNLPLELVGAVLDARKVREPWRDFWLKAIYAMSLADEIRFLLTSYLRAKKAGVVLPEDLEKAVEGYFKLVGVTAEEMNIRSLAVQIDTIIESYPSLGALASIAEYVNVPLDYVAKVLALRRVEKTFAELWIQYLQTRQISTEVARVVAVFTQLVTRYDVPRELTEQVQNLMLLGGWTEREREVWTLELQLRRIYRELSLLLPSVRTFISDAMYLPDTESLLRNLFVAYGLDVNKYSAQLEYYKKLIKNRRLWRHFATLRSQLIYAYGYGAVSLEQVKQILQKYKSSGLIDDDEIAMIIEACELYRLRRLASS